MSKGDRSINQRLLRAKAPGLKQEIAKGWAREWESDQRAALDRLAGAVRRQDWPEADRQIAVLEAITSKRFRALPGVIDQISGSKVHDS